MHSLESNGERVKELFRSVPVGAIISLTCYLEILIGLNKKNIILLHKHRRGKSLLLTLMNQALSYIIIGVES